MSVIDKDLVDAIKAYEAPKHVFLDFSTSTGIASLDVALGGRLPSGATEIYGEASSGKTTLLCQIIATAQKEGSIVALCPTEYLDIPYLRTIGVDLNSLILITGNYGEDVLDGAMSFIEEHRDVSCILAVDSATSMRPKNDSLGRWTVMMDTFLERAIPRLGLGSGIVMTNQVRTKKSIRPGKTWVNGDVDSTSRRLLDRFGTRLELSRTDVKEGEYLMAVNVVASTYSRPQVLLEIPVEKGYGIDTMLDLIRVATASGVIETSGSWYSFEGSSLGQGERQAASTLSVRPVVVGRILDRINMRA